MEEMHRLRALPCGDGWGSGQTGHMLTEGAAAEAEMTPESPEGRERLVRAEERIESNRRQIDALAPLIKDVGLLQWNLSELAGDLKEFRQDMREQRAEDQKKRADEIHELRRSMSDQILVIADGLKTCSTQVKEVADAQRAWQEAERDRREAERVKREENATQRAIAKYAPTATLIVGLLAFLGIIIQTLFGG